MRAIVIYEPMYGNAPVADASPRPRGCAVHLDRAERPRREREPAGDLVVIGGPTHVHGMSGQPIGRPRHAADEPASGLAVDPAGGPGVREWLAAGRRDGRRPLGHQVDMPAALTAEPRRGSRSSSEVGFHWSPSPRASSSTRTTGWSMARTSGAPGMGCGARVHDLGAHATG